MIGLRHIFHVLFENGDGDIALKMMCQEEAPSYANMIKLGGTALFVCAVGFAFGGRSIGRRMENFVPAVCMAVMMMFISSLPSFDFAFVLMLSLGALRDGGGSNSLSTQRNIQIGQNRFRSY
jgi:ABC-type dipeptide/oligopeptide/nickel transport system permease component